MNREVLIFYEVSASCPSCAGWNDNGSVFKQTYRDNFSTGTTDVP